MVTIEAAISSQSSHDASAVPALPMVPPASSRSRWPSGDSRCEGSDKAEHQRQREQQACCGERIGRADEGDDEVIDQDLTAISVSS
jgi:hypothetical protein